MNRTFLITLLLYGGSLLAQDDPQKMIDTFFRAYGEKSADPALNYIFGTNKWMDESKDQIENIKFRLNATLKVVGKFQGRDLITKRTIGDHYCLYTFLVRHERQPLRFSFLFYQPNDQWRLQNFSFDDNIEEELREGAKIYRLKENVD